MNPIVEGDYPAVMRSIVQNRLPKFTKEESSMLKGSFDFIGLNYYTANYAAHISTPNPNLSCSTDNMVHLSCKLIVRFFIPMKLFWFGSCKILLVFSKLAHKFRKYKI